MSINNAYSSHYKKSKYILNESRLIQDLQRMKSKDSSPPAIVLKNIFLSNEDVQVLSEMLMVNKVIEYIEIDNCELNDSSAYFLFEALRGNRTLKYLDLSNNHITFNGAKELFQALKINKSVMFVGLRNNMLNVNVDEDDTIFQVIETTRMINDIDISQNSLDCEMVIKFAKAVSVNSRKIHHLNIAHNEINNSAVPSINEILSKYSRVEHLDISGAELDGTGLMLLLNEGLFISGNLRKFIFSGWEQSTIDNMTTFIQSFTESNRNVTYLDISKNNAIDHFNILVKSSFLTTIKVNNCIINPEELGQISLSLSQNKTLTHLDISHSIFSNSALFFQHLNKNKILKILKFAGNTVSEDDLFIVGALKTIPLEILVLNDVTGLQERDDILKVLSSHRSISELEIQNICNSEKIFEIFKDNYANNTALQYLDLSRNIPKFDDPLEIVSDWLDLYTKSKYLVKIWVDGSGDDDRLTEKYLSHLKIETLPDNILKMYTITLLDISHNNITSLPKDISSLINLKILDCSENKIQVLPTSLASLQHLTQLIVTGNPIASHPNIAQKKTSDILQYLHDLVEETVYYNSSIMLLGDSGTGKSLLLKTIQRRLKNKKEIKSGEVIIEDYQMDVQNDKRVHFRTYDFQIYDELFKALFKFYINGQTFCLVVFDLEKSENHLDYWIQSVSEANPEAPIILVGTRADKFEDTDEIMDVLFSLNEFYRPIFPQILDVMAVDLENGDLGSLLNRIEEYIDLNDSMQLSIPKSVEILGKKLASCLPFADDVTLQDAKIFCQFNSDSDFVCAMQQIEDLYYYKYFNNKGLQLNVLVTDPLYLVELVRQLYAATDFTIFRNGIVPYDKVNLIWTEHNKADYPTIVSILLYMKLIYYLREIEQHGGPVNTLFSSLSKSRYKTSMFVPYYLYKRIPIKFLPKNFDWVREYHRKINLKILPGTLFDSILVNFMSISTSVVYYWKFGIAGYFGADFYLVTIDEENRDIDVCVRCDSNSSHTLVKCISIIKMLIDRSPTSIPIIESVPCLHCINLLRTNINYFLIYDLELKAANGQWDVTCEDVTIPLRDLAPDASLEYGDGIAPYPYKNLEVIKEIGKGAFGTIYLGYWEEDVVAIKTLDANIDTDEMKHEGYMDIKHEIKIMSDLRHSNLVRLYAYAIEPFAIVMELCSYGNLFDFVNNPDSPRDYEITLKIAIDIAKGMNFLHFYDPPIIHRDLKSPNVLLKSIDPLAPVCAQVADFGLTTKLYIPEIVEKTVDRDVVNPTWLAPEVMREELFNESADVYSFGIILWELIARAYPFAEFNYRFMFEQEDAVKNGIRPTLPDFTPSEYSLIVKRSWADKPSDRFTFVEILEKLVSMASVYAPMLYMPEDILVDMEIDPLFLDIQTSEKTIKLIGYLESDENKFYSIVPFGSNQFIWSGTRSGDIECFSCITGKNLGKISSLHESAITEILLVNNNSNIITFSPMKSLRLWKFHSTPQICDLEQKEMSNPEYSGSGFLRKKLGNGRDTYDACNMSIHSKKLFLVKNNCHIPFKIIELKGAELLYDRVKRGAKFILTVIPLNKNPIYLAWEKESELLSCKTNINIATSKKDHALGLHFVDGLTVNDIFCIAVIKDELWGGGSKLQKWQTNKFTKVPTNQIDKTLNGLIEESEFFIRKIFQNNNQIWMAIGRYLVQVDHVSLEIIVICTGHDSEINDIFSKGNNIITCADDGRVILWDSTTYLPLKDIQVDTTKLYCVRYHDELIWTAGFSGKLYNYNSITDELRLTETAHTDGITSFSFSNNKLWVASWDGISVWSFSNQ